MEIIKDYDNFKCVLKHDMNNEILVMEMWRQGKLFFVSSVRNVEIMLFNTIANDLTKEETLSMYQLDMSAL